MFLGDYFWNRLGYFFYGLRPISLRLLMNLLEVGEKFLFYYFMIFYSFSLSILDVSDGIFHSPLNSSMVKKLGISFTFL